MKQLLLTGLVLAFSAVSIAAEAARDNPLPSGQYTRSTLPQGVVTCGSLAGASPTNSQLIVSTSGKVECALKYGDQFDFRLTLPAKMVPSCNISAGKIEYFRYRYDDNWGRPVQAGRTIDLNSGIHFTIASYYDDPAAPSNDYYLNVADTFDRNDPNNDPNNPIYILFTCEPINPGDLRRR